MRNLVVLAAFILPAALSAGCGKDDGAKGTAGTATATAAPAAAATGVPECDEYLAAVERAIACPELDEPTRTSLRAEADAWKKHVASWAAMGADQRATVTGIAADTCRASASAARATASSFGCKR